MTEFDDRDPCTILDRLDSNDEGDAWASFLQEYSPLIMQVVRLFETHQDQVSDCFVFVCQQLERDRFRRLKRFNIDGSASFPTWLRVVVRNLYLDWRRQEHGRPRLFRSITRLSGLDQEIYRCVFERGMASGEAFRSLRIFFPTLTEDQVACSLERIGRTLTSRQRWLLTSQNPRFESLSEDPDDSRPTVELSSLAADPLDIATQQQLRSLLRRALSRLSPSDRLLVRLRFEQGLSLERVAKIAGLADGRRADRRIKEILKCLRDKLEVITRD
jgi:RNA polymerase sigma factor (sigma-70 family)